MLRIYYGGIFGLWPDPEKLPFNVDQHWSQEGVGSSIRVIIGIRGPG
jgi:hypothetical protein